MQATGAAAVTHVGCHMHNLAVPIVSRKCRKTASYYSSGAYFSGGGGVLGGYLGTATTTAALRWLAVLRD